MCVCASAHAQYFCGMYMHTWNPSHAQVEWKTLTCTSWNHSQGACKRYHIVHRKEELLWCLQAYVKTSHRPARSLHQTYAQEICPVDVVRNTWAQNMVQHSFSNHVDHIRRQTHGHTHTHDIFLRSNWQVYARKHTHAHTHTHTTPWAMMNAYTCLIKSSKTTLSLSPRVCACVSSEVCVCMYVRMYQHMYPHARSINVVCVLLGTCVYVWMHACASICILTILECTGSGRPVCIHTTHKNPWTVVNVQSCLIEKHMHTHTHTLSELETHTHGLLFRDLTLHRQARLNTHTHTHKHIHTCTQRFAFGAEITHRLLFLTFK